MLSSVEQAFVGRDEIRAPLKTPAWEARGGGGMVLVSKKIVSALRASVWYNNNTKGGGGGGGASPGSATARHSVRKVPISIPRCDKKSFS